MPISREAPRFYGGTWCLDFANTVEPRHGSDQKNLLPDYPALARWARDGGIVGSSAYQSLVRTADRQPKAAGMAHARAITLREATYRAFAALAGDGEPKDRDLSRIHATYVEALQHARPRISDDGLAWNWPATSLDYPRWRVAVDAVELLRSEQLDRVKSCSPSCAWLFLDTTKNRSRRWCSMRECGFGEKARLQAERRRLRSGP